MATEPIEQSISREERKALKRAARMQEDGRSRRRRAVRRALRWGIGIGVIALVLWWMIQKIAFQPGVAVPNLGNQHIKAVTDPHTAYNSIPPTSGPHVGNIAPWGIHTEPIPDALQVHNLEDGGVAIQYNCDLLTTNEKEKTCNNLVTQLRDIVERFSKEVILAPYPKLDRVVALTAWNRIDTWDPPLRTDGTIDLDKKRVKKFINAYRGIDHHVRSSAFQP